MKYIEYYLIEYNRIPHLGKCILKKRRHCNFSERLSIYECAESVTLVQRFSVGAGRCEKEGMRERLVTLA